MYEWSFSLTTGGGILMVSPGKRIFWDSHGNTSDPYLSGITSLRFQSPISLNLVLEDVQLGIQQSQKQS